MTASIYDHVQQSQKRLLEILPSCYKNHRTAVINLEKAFLGQRNSLREKQSNHFSSE